MPRARKYFLPGHLWHITHRCHKQEFLLKFIRDRKAWQKWLFEARKRFGLCILNYCVTSNHRLLVRDTGDDAISKSIQLIAGNTAQEYNRRKSRKGAFWEDRYHATAIETGSHFLQCMAYIDLNMVRAGVVNHPSEWSSSGFNEIQSPPQRYLLIDKTSLRDLYGVSDDKSLQRTCKQIAERVLADCSVREPQWSESIAVGVVFGGGKRRLGD